MDALFADAPWLVQVIVLAGAVSTAGLGIVAGLARFTNLLTWAGRSAIDKLGDVLTERLQPNFDAAASDRDALRAEQDSLTAKVDDHDRRIARVEERIA